MSLLAKRQHEHRFGRVRYTAIHSQEQIQHTTCLTNFVANHKEWNVG